MEEATRGLGGKNGQELSWKSFAVFSESIKDDMPELGEIGKGGAEYFAHYPECFFNEAIASFLARLGAWRNFSFISLLVITLIIRH